MTSTDSNERELLRTFLKHRDVYCPRCRFSLRNAVSDRCAECGCDLQLSVSDSAPPMGLIAIMIAAIAAPLGVIAPIWADLIWQAYNSTRNQPNTFNNVFNKYDWMSLGVASLSILIVMILVTLIVRSCRWLCRGASRRWLIALIAIAFGASIHFGFMYSLRDLGSKAIQFQYSP